MTPGAHTVARGRRRWLTVVLVGCLLTLLQAGAGRADEPTSLSVQPDPAIAADSMTVTGSHHCASYQEPDTGVSRVLIGFSLTASREVKASYGAFTAELLAPRTAGSYLLTTYCLNYITGKVIKQAAVKAVTVVDTLPPVDVTVTPNHALALDSLQVKLVFAPAPCLKNGAALKFDDAAVSATWEYTGGAPVAVGVFVVPSNTTAGKHEVTAGCARKGAGPFWLPPVPITISGGTGQVGPNLPSSSTPFAGSTNSVPPQPPPSPARSTTSTGGGPAGGRTSPPPAAQGPGTASGSLGPVDQGNGTVRGEPIKRAAVATWLRPPSDPGLLDPGHILTCAVLALTLMLLIGFPAQLFESTFEENHDRIMHSTRWLRRWRLPLPRLPRPVAFALFVLLATVLYGLTDPNFGHDPQQTLLDATGFLVALPLVTLGFAVPVEWYSRRGGRPPAHFRMVPAALIIAIACTALSVAGHFQPGYVYGLIAGYATVNNRRLTTTQSGRAVLIGACAIASLSLIAWVIWDPIDVTLSATGGGVLQLVIDATLATTVVVGVQALAFQLLPITFLDGHAVNSWSHLWWRSTYAVALFALIFVTFYPRTRADTANVQVLSMLALFVAFGLASIAFWAYFRYTPSPPPRR